MGFKVLTSGFTFSSLIIRQRWKIAKDETIKRQKQNFSSSRDFYLCQRYHLPKYSKHLKQARYNFLCKWLVNFVFPSHLASKLLLLQGNIILADVSNVSMWKSRGLQKMYVYIPIAVFWKQHIFKRKKIGMFHKKTFGTQIN